MNAPGLRAAALAISVCFSAGAGAQAMSKDQYQAGRAGLDAEQKSEKAACGSLAGNARGICTAEADGRAMVGRAELEAGYKPSLDASYNLSLAKANAAYAVEREKCNDSAGNVKDAGAAKAGCLQDARLRYGKS